MQIAVILAAQYKDGRALGREPAQYSPAKEQQTAPITHASMVHAMRRQPGSVSHAASQGDRPSVLTPLIGGALPGDGKLGIGALYRSNAALQSSIVVLALMLLGYALQDEYGLRSPKRQSRADQPFLLTVVCAT